jgi:hypothetical protein
VRTRPCRLYAVAPVMRGQRCLHGRFPGPYTLSAQLHMCADPRDRHVCYWQHGVFRWCDQHVPSAASRSDQPDDCEFCRASGVLRTPFVSHRCFPRYCSGGRRSQPHPRHCVCPGYSVQPDRALYHGPSYRRLRRGSRRNERCALCTFDRSGSVCDLQMAGFQ